MKIGRYCELKGISEEKDLKIGMDFRNPRFRREVFLRFYEFQLKYKAHPGAVYYVFPELFEQLQLTKEQKYWFCFLNGCCQNVLSTYVMFKNFPDVSTLNLDEFNTWFRSIYPNLGWDVDRRYVKNSLLKCIESYKKNLGNFNQETFFERYLCKTPDKYLNFERSWDKVIKDFYAFGRLSVFSYLEYLQIAGLNIDCNSLFINDLEGSKSHRNGLCKVLGRDDLDWHKSNPSFPGYSTEGLSWLRDEGEKLLEEAKQRMPNENVSYFTLESTLCSFKSWFRKNRRYPNVYNDMFHDRIKYAESKWKDQEDFSIFWDIRKKVLPEFLRLEDNPKDPGVKPIKQNHFRETGQVILMNKDWGCFQNDFNS